MGLLRQTTTNAEYNLLWRKCLVLEGENRELGKLVVRLDAENAKLRGEVTMDAAMFEYLKPTDAQVDDMGVCRKAAAQYAAVLEDMVPEGPDKTYLMRKLREVAMWANVAITRHADGAARVDQGDEDAGQ